MKATAKAKAKKLLSAFGRIWIGLSSRLSSWLTSLFFHLRKMALPSRLSSGLAQLPGGLRLWISLLSLGFLLAALVGNGQQLLMIRLEAQAWCWLALAVGVSLLSLVVNGLAWGVIVGQLGLKPRWQPLVASYLSSNLRKYLPGGIWHLAQRVQLLRQEDAPLEQPASASRALLAVLLDPLLAAIAALALVALGGWQGGLGGLALLPLLALHPRWLTPLLLRLERREAQRLDIKVNDSGQQTLAATPWRSLLALLAFVLTRFAGFACCLQALELTNSLAWNDWLASFALAWTVGLVVPAAPGGAGVFEATLLLRLAGALPEAQLLAVAISYRLVVTIADLIAAGAARWDLGEQRQYEAGRRIEASAE
jgi:uncharacterized membrane protein YbhN (UPF0104 family)